MNVNNIPPKLQKIIKRDKYMPILDVFITIIDCMIGYGSWFPDTLFMKSKNKKKKNSDLRNNKQ